MLKNLDTNALGPKRVVQMLLGAGALVLVIGAIITFLMNSQIRDMQATVSGKEAQVGSNEQIAQRYDQTEKDYNEIASRTQYLEASVSAKSFVPTLLKQLQALATTTHLTVTAVRPGAITSPAPPPAAPGAPATGDAAAGSGADVKKAPPPPYDTLDIGVDVVGTYADTAAFLYNLTRFPKIISVSSVQMHPGGGDAAPGVIPAAPTLTTNLHLTAFVFHSEAGVPASGNAAAPLATADAAAPIATADAAAPIATAAAVGPAPAYPGVATAPRPAPLSAISAAAAHAAGRAVGASKAARDRDAVGIQTL